MKTSTTLLLATSLALSLACGGSGSGPSLVLTPRADLMAKCDGGDMEACADLGGDLATGEFGPKNTSGAAKPLQLACDANIARSCTVLATINRTQSVPLPPTHTRQSLYQKGCDLGFPLSCTELGLEIASANGEPSVAVEAFTKGCNGDDAGGCLSLAALTLEGIVIPKDPTEGQRLMKRACDLDSGDACFRLSKLVHPSNPTEAATLKKKACELGFTDACS